MRISVNQLRYLIRESVKSSKARSKTQQPKQHQKAAASVVVTSTQTHSLERIESYARGTQLGFIGDDVIDEEEYNEWWDDGRGPGLYVVTRKKPRKDGADMIFIDVKNNDIRTRDGDEIDDLPKAVASEFKPLIAAALKDHKSRRNMLK